MAYCSQCGNQVAESALYCAKCGARQPVTPRSASDPLAGITPRTASILCYVPIVGWIASIVVLAASKFRGDRIVRFHAFQGLYLFVAWLIVEHVIQPMFQYIHGPIFPFGHVLQLFILLVWIFMMIKTSHEEVYSLPIIGELAERSISES